MKLIFATHNQGKIKEMKAMLADLNIEVLSAEEAGVVEDVIEDGKTFAENALKKAKFVSQKTGLWAVADDSGICINCLDGLPGVYSARWAGEGASGEQLVNFTLEKIKSKDPKDLSAYFESAVALVSPDGEQRVFSGKVNGLISLETKGKPREKLPYDVIFIPEGFSQTFAEMSDGQKNSLSHRGKAFAQLKTFLATRLEKP